MLIFKSTDKVHKSIYICDRCGMKLVRGSNKVYRIYVNKKNEHPKKKWDLCEKDYFALVKGMEKRKK